MVDLARELDDEDEEQTQEKAGKKKSPVIKIIVLSLAVVLLIGISVGVTLFLTGGKSLLGGGHAAADTKEEQAKNPLYFALDPPFVVNFADQNQMRFLQVAIEIMSYDPKAIAAVKKNMPVIRNNLVMLLSSQDTNTLFSLAGKEKLRQEALQEIQKVVKEHTGEAGIEAVYFTSFVMQ